MGRNAHAGSTPARGTNKITHMSTTDQMKEELLQTQDSLEFMLRHLKEAHKKAAHCNPFVETMLFDMVKQIRDIQFKLADIRRSVNITEVVVK